VIYSYNKTNEIHEFLIIYLWNRTSLASDRFSVHHQESSTVYTAIGICHTGNADWLLAGSGQSSVLIPLPSETLAGASETLAGASETLAGASETLAGASETLTGASETQVRLLDAISRCRFKLPRSLEFFTECLIFTD